METVEERIETLQRQIGGILREVAEETSGMLRSVGYASGRTEGSRLGPGVVAEGHEFIVKWGPGNSVQVRFCYSHVGHFESDKPMSVLAEEVGGVIAEVLEDSRSVSICGRDETLSEHIEAGRVSKGGD